MSGVLTDEQPEEWYHICPEMDTEVYVNGEGLCCPYCSVEFHRDHPTIEVREMDPDTHEVVVKKEAETVSEDDDDE